MAHTSFALKAALSAYEKAAPKIRIIAGPAVFESGDCYSIVWATSHKGSGCIKYIKNGKEKTVWDAAGGAIRTDDNVHFVRIPKTEFIGCKYKVRSQGVRFKFGYSALKGKCTESEFIEFGGTEKDDDIYALAISDVHDIPHLAQKAISHFEKKPDIILLLGDICSETEKKSEYINNLLKFAGEISKGEIPVVYTRGNHETRGEFASQMIKYFPSETGEFYFTFKFGALSAIVIDSGEDKEDAHPEYSGLVDFDSYRKKEFEWLCSLNTDVFGGRYNLAFSHIPFISEHFGKDWTKPLIDLGADMLIGGHIHYSYYDDGGKIKVLSVCGKNGKTGTFGATMLHLKDGKIEIQTVNDKGETLLKA